MQLAWLCWLPAAAFRFTHGTPTASRNLLKFSLRSATQVPVKFGRATTTTAPSPAAAAGAGAVVAAAAASGAAVAILSSRECDQATSFKSSNVYTHTQPNHFNNSLRLSIMASSAADDSGAIVDAIRQSSGSGNTEAVQRAIDGSGSGDINAIVTIKVGEVSLHSANTLSC